MVVTLRKLNPLGRQIVIYLRNFTSSSQKADAYLFIYFDKCHTVIDPEDEEREKTHRQNAQRQNHTDKCDI